MKSEIEPKTDQKRVSLKEKGHKERIGYDYENVVKQPLYEES